MGMIKDAFFGGAEKKAAKAQAAATEKAMEITKEGVEEARGTLNEMHPLALSMLGGSAQQGVDLMAQAAPESARLIQEGNTGAQQQLADSLPMIQAALLGQPIDFSKLQPSKLARPNMGFLNQKVAPTINVDLEEIARAAQAPQQPVMSQQPSSDMFASMLGGNFGGNFGSDFGASSAMKQGLKNKNRQ